MVKKSMQSSYIGWSENGNLKKGGGVCMYITNNLNYSESALSHLNVTSRNMEVQCVLFKSKCKDYCKCL